MTFLYLEYPLCIHIYEKFKFLLYIKFNFREVFKARHKKTKKIVALKKVLMENEKEGVSVYFLISNYER